MTDLDLLSSGPFGGMLGSGGAGIGGYASARLGIARQELREQRKLEALTDPKGYLRSRNQYLKSKVTPQVNKEFKEWLEYFQSQGRDIDSAKELAVQAVKPTAARLEAKMEAEYPSDIMSNTAAQVVRANAITGGLSGVGIFGGGGSGRRRTSRKSGKRSKKSKR